MLGIMKLINLIRGFDMSVYKKHQDKIKKQNNKYPLMEYFLDNKPLKECSVECQKQLNQLNLKA
mgnify:CR=1 FL=1